jgi:hypothetical protein
VSSGFMSGISSGEIFPGGKRNLPGEVVVLHAQNTTEEIHYPGPSALLRSFLITTGKRLHCCR